MVLTNFAIVARYNDKMEGSGGLTPFTFTVTRAGDTSLAQTVDWLVEIGDSGTGVTAADFAPGTALSGSLAFAIGETSKTITLNVAGDVDDEFNEAFAVVISNPSGGGLLGTPSARSIIRNDDTAIGEWSILPVSADRAEGNSGTTPYTFVIARTVGTNNTVNVSYFVDPNTTGMTNSDFVGIQGATITFLPGQASKTVTIDVAGDAVAEADELFAVQISSISGGTGSLSPGRAFGYVRNDDVGTLPVITISQFAGFPEFSDQPEGSSGTTPFYFEVTRTGNTFAASSVLWTVVSSSATGADFIGGALPFGVVSFEADETTKQVTVNVQGDTLVEGDEAFSVQLSAPTNATLGNATTQGIIRNDDAAAGAVMSIAATDAAKAEGDAGGNPFVFQITRTGDTASNSSVRWAVTGGSGLTNTDFAFTNTYDWANELPNGIVSFVAGETSKTILINIAGDTTVETSENFTVTLSVPLPAGAVIGTATAQGIIQNDDAGARSVSIAALSADKNEGNSGTTPFTFTVTRTGDTSATESVLWAVSSATANAVDFNGVLPSGTVTFNPGETSKTVTINVTGDANNESDEAFTITLSNPSAGVTIGNATAQGVIRNDDVANPGTVSIADASLTEGNSGTSQMAFTLTRTGGSAAFSLNYISGPGTASTVDNDYAGTGGTLSFAAGENSKTIFVTINGDTRPERDETFFVQLANPTNGAALADSTATGTILDDEPNTRPVATPTAFVTNLTRANASPLLSSLVAATDADGDTITRWQFWESTPGSGEIAISGVVQPANTLVDIDASQYNTAAFYWASDGYDWLWARAFDGTDWSDWTNFYVIAPENHAPVATPTNVVTFLTRANTSPLLSSFVSATDSDGDPITHWQFWDASPGNGSIAITGVVQAANTLVEIDDFQYDTAAFYWSSTGWDNIWARAYDGSTWGAWTSFYVVAPVNHAPVATASNFVTQLTRANDNPLLSSLASATDSDGDAVARWQIWDASAGNGGVYQGATRLGDNTLIDLSAAEFATARYEAGGNYDNLWVRASDGNEWGDWINFWMISPPNAAPSLTPASTAFSGGGQARNLALILNTFDTDGDTLFDYEIWDQTIGNGFFTVNGVAQAAQMVIGVGHAQVAQTSFTSGPGDDDVWVRAYDGYSWSNWTYFRLDNLLV